MSALTGFLNGFAGGAQRQKDRKLRRRELSIMENQGGRGPERSVMRPNPQGDVYGPSPTNQPGASSGGVVSRDPVVNVRPNSGGDANPYRTDDPVATDIPDYGRAFLNTVAGPESGGQYNVRYTPGGGVNFEGFDQHPRIYEDGPHGRSSAAGRYQFTNETWEDTGGGNFSPENQDRRAWQLAQDRYRAYTGGNLADELQNGGVTAEMLQSLSPTWAGFSNGNNRQIATYNDSMARYAAARPQPQQRSVIAQPWQNLPQ